MKWTIKTGLTRTYALRQYENIKPMIEIEVEFDTNEKDFNWEKTLEALKIKCDKYIDRYNPTKETEYDWPLPF